MHVLSYALARRLKKAHGAGKTARLQSSVRWAAGKAGKELFDPLTLGLLSAFWEEIIHFQARRQRFCILAVCVLGGDWVFQEGIELGCRVADNPDMGTREALEFLHCLKALTR